MGTSPLGAKLTRRIAREVGHPIKRAVGHGGYEFEFVTFDHEHGWWNKRDGDFGLYDSAGPLLHWSSCRWNFDGEPVPDHFCGARTSIHALDLICSELKDGHGPKHRCGSESWEAHPCGHGEAVEGCGGCDPGAIEFVVDNGVVRPFDPARDMTNRSGAT